MPKTVTVAAALTAAFVFFFVIVIGLLDLFRGANAAAALVGSIFVVAAIFNIWIAFTGRN